MRKPRILAPGDTIAVVSPGAAVEAQAIEAGIRELQSLGYHVQRGRHLLDRSGFLAGSDAERLTDLHDAFSDPSVKAIIAARGGYGCGRLLPLLTPEIFAEPKIFIGHSDLTFLLNYIVEKAGMVVFHGPLAAGLSHAAGTSLHEMVSGQRGPWRQSAEAVIRSGTAEGQLTGGCLSIVTAMLGTPWALPTRGKLLFLEDINEKPYRIDRMLTQLRQAGAFAGVAGVIFGEMTGCTAGPQESVSVRDVIESTFAEAPFPVAFGLPSGHGVGTAILPLGVRARLAGERLTLLEPPLQF